MNIILLKISPHINKRSIYAYVDVEIVDMKIKIKGFKMMLYKGKISVHLPMIRKENDKMMFTPIIFLDPEFLNDLKQEIIKKVSETYPLTEWEKGVYIKDLPVK